MQSSMRRCDQPVPPRLRLHRRAGVTILETIGTCLLIAAALGAAAPLIVMVSRQHQAVSQRQLATQYAANLLEQMVARSWDDLPPGTIPLEPAEDMADVLPEPNVQVEVFDLKQVDLAKRIGVSVSWRDRAGQRVTPIQLSAWVYPDGKGAK